MTTMHVEAARSLATFINENSTRYHATVLDFAEHGWVIVTDRNATSQRSAYQEPIADPEDYLNRARRGTLKMEAAYRRLLEQWLGVVPA